METTITWSLKNVTAVDNYVLKAEDGTETLMNGVVTAAVLECEAVNSGETAKHPYVNVPFKAPVPDAFAPLDTIEKATVLEWALGQLPAPVKENVEKMLSKKVEGTAPVANTIFDA